MSIVREDRERHKTFLRRVLMLGCAKGALLTALAGRLYYLQILEGEKYKTLAEDNRISLRLLSPERGRILDRFGAAVADNRDNFRVLLVRELAPDVSETLRRLGQLIPVSDYDRKRVLRDIAKKRAFVPVTVKENLAWEQVARIEGRIADLPGLSIERGNSRNYEYGADMAHVLGYVAAVSERELNGDPLLELPGFRIGKSGIEKFYDYELRGAAGAKQVEINAYGREIRELSRKEASSGKEVVLTIDSGLQVFVQQRLLSEQSAASVVLDIETGDVLALGSIPSFSPTAFDTGLSQGQWDALVNNPMFPLTNKAIAGAYAPGSAFKMVVALAALAEGISPENYTVFCNGHITLGTARFHCWKRSGHGRVNMLQSLQHSCDVFYYNVSRHLGIGKIAAMAERLGLGRPVGIDLPGEKGGLVPSRGWREANIGGPWQVGETLVASIGQGFVLATPLQLAVMVARIASGRAVRPCLARGYRELGQGYGYGVPPFESLNISQSHLDSVLKGMDLVVNDRGGTAYRARIKERGWEMAGKTATSQVRRISLEERQAGVLQNDSLPWRRRDHALFVGVAPLHRPRYSCAVVVEHGGSGAAVAAPICRDILTEVQRRNTAGREALVLENTVPPGLFRRGAL